MNRYNHPRPEGIQRLEEENIQIFNKICTKFYMNVLQFLGFYFSIIHERFHSTQKATLWNNEHRHLYHPQYN